MAITKVTAPNSVPTAVSDYEAQNNHLIGFINQVNNQSFILTDPTGTDAPNIKQGSYINHGGNLYLVDTEDYTPSGSPADGNVYIRVSGDATLTAEFITDISGYAYNQAYGNMVNSTYTLLPYLLVLASSAWTKYRLDVTTPQYRMNQDLRTTDSPVFADPTFTSLTLGTAKGMRVSYEGLGTIGASTNISAMSIGEMRYVTGSGSSASGYYIKTPVAAGVYVTIQARTIETTTLMKSLAQNTNITNDTSVIILIFRIS